MTVLALAIGLLALLALAYLRAPAWIWAAGFAVATLTAATAGIAWPWQGLLWLAVAGSVVAAMPALRRRCLSGPLLPLFRRVMPRMSDTERAALEAGTVWWEAELFSGRPRWQRLQAVPAARLSPREQAFLDGPVDTLCATLDDWMISHQHRDLPPEVWQLLKQARFFGMIIPRDYGGLGFSALAHSQVVMKVASRSVAAAVTVMVPNSLGPAELLLRYGTPQQKDYYLPRLARGDEIPCFALTGPDAGSDASAMTDTGIVCRARFQGRNDVLGIRLNWSKRYITLGPVATLLGLAFKLYDPDRLLGTQTDIGITLALIPTDTPGIDIGRRHDPLNLAFQNGPTTGRDVFIPIEWIIGGVARRGQGWTMLMECLAAGRAISLPALSTGAGKLASRAAGAYARVRRQFRLPIGRFEGIEEPLARIGAFGYMMNAARLLTATAVDLGEKPALISAIVKYQLTEHMRRVINDAMDIQAGVGICMGPHNLFGRVYQALPISITVEGANILTRSLIIFGQGALRCHPYVLREMMAVHESDPHQALVKFDRALAGHLGHIVSNAARAWVLALTGARLAGSPAGPNRRHYQQLARLSAAFACTADAAMVLLGGALKRREKLSGRLADAFSHLYLASATLKYFEDSGSPAAERPLLEWVLAYNLNTVQAALAGVIDNLPNRLAALALRGILFPLGKPYKPPSDRLGRRVAQLLLEPGPLRDKLTGGIYLPSGADERLRVLDDALRAVVAAEPIEARVRDAVRGGELPKLPSGELPRAALAAGIIEAHELQAIETARAARRRAIEVDAFEADDFSREVHPHAQDITQQLQPASLSD